MKAGLLAIFQNYENGKTDAQVYQDVMSVMESAEDLGYDFLLATEHHFTDYSMCPDNTNVLTYLAGKTNTIKLGTGAIIVPWNDPLRCASKMLMLDQLSKGRALLGVGRGLARVEYELLGLNMSESRERFDEGARMIINALKTGYIESAGPMFPQKRAHLRPGPYNPDWDGRIFCVGMSPASVVEAGKLGARLMSFSNTNWDVFRRNSLAPYLETYENEHGCTAPPIVTGDLIIVHEDEERARELAVEHFSNYYYTVSRFYDLTGDHFQQVKGYESYASAAQKIKDLGDDELAKAYVEFNLYGTPAQIVEKIAERRRLLDHPFDIALIFEGGGISAEDMTNSVRLFAQKILPKIETIQ
jgi:alkanesulfonate monooxygenase SsuD/methylene tetrahydromethanopterin reductase-like flavin-dependent oxidoreductase (luciferase family)